MNQLWSFLEHAGIPLTKEGRFLAYKGVRENYLDVHSGTFKNTPGAVLQMDRNKVSDDPETPCHEGFHVGELSYATSFGKRVVVCEVDPADVVCVPYDSAKQKMRVCKYRVVGNHNGELLDSTSFDDDIRSDRYVTADFNVVEDEEEETITDERGVVVEPPEQQKVQGKKSKKGWKKFDAMDMKGLMEQSIDDLRQYAGKGLDIVGASKIPGGKTSLVRAILKTRGAGK